MAVKIEVCGSGVLNVILNRPEKLNAFNEDMRRKLLDGLRKASADKNVRVVIISGEGRAFCTGADVTELDDSESIEDMLNTEYGALLTLIQTMPKPVIAAINGPAAGIGMTFALTCDLQVMAADAYLMCAFANIGLVPDGGLSWLLTRQIGYARAFQAAVEAEKINAEKALASGLVNRVVPASHAVSAAVAWAHELSKRSSTSMALTKSTFRQAAQNGLRDAMVREALAQRLALADEDSTEGIQALLEKRNPVFDRGH